LQLETHRHFSLRSAQVRRISWVRGVVGRGLVLMASSYHLPKLDRPLITFKKYAQKNRPEAVRSIEIC